MRKETVLSIFFFNPSQIL